MVKVDNAIIMAAGVSSRFSPLSHEIPKCLVSVKGEILIERQIRQLQEKGIQEIVVVTGYKHEMLSYLKDMFGVILVHNNDFYIRNNHSSIHAAREYLNNSYVCSSDNYYSVNPFEPEVDDSFYSTVFVDGATKEWCVEVDSNDVIQKVTIGGHDSWVMLGHTFWSKDFSRKFLSVLDKVYNHPETYSKLWESIYIDHIDELPMKIRRYEPNCIYEFDSIDELRRFDYSYITDTKSQIIKDVAHQLHIPEAQINRIEPIFKGNDAIGFTFYYQLQKYQYLYDTKQLSSL